MQFHLKKHLSSLILLFSILVLSPSCLAQYHINGTFTGPIQISEVFLEQYTLTPQVVSSAQVVNNSFQCIIPNTISKGVYRLRYKSGQSSSSIDLVITGKENIAFTMELSSSELIPPFFSDSETNILWYKEKQKAITIQQKIEVLKQAYTLYPTKTDDIVEDIKNSILNQIKSQEKTIRSLRKSHPFIGVLIGNSQPKPWFNPKASLNNQDSLFIVNYWKGLETNRIELLNSPIYSQLIFNYINIHLNKARNMLKSQQDVLLKSCVDQILVQFTEEETRIFATDYLIHGFKQLGNETVLQYIDETYAVVDQCDNPNALNTRLEGYKKLKPGNRAPAIIQAGKNILDQTLDRPTLVVFWASWCPHCMQEVPEIYEWAKNTPVNVVAISLDTEEQAFKNTVQPWTNMTHYCDLKKWDSQPVKDYFVKGTPTYFLLDKDQNIIKKHTSFQEVKIQISKL